MRNSTEFQKMTGGGGEVHLIVLWHIFSWRIAAIVSHFKQDE
jgi:hypothetical protein